MTFTLFTRLHFYRKSWIVNLLLSHGGNETTNSSTIDHIEEELERIATLQYIYVSICVPSWALGGSGGPYWRGNRTNRDPALFLCKCIHSTTQARCGFMSPYRQGNRANRHPVVSICMQAFLPVHSVGQQILTLHLPRTNPYPAFAQNKSLPCICPEQILTLHLPRTNPYPAFAQNKSLPCICPEQILTLHLPRTNPYPAFAQNKSLPCICPEQILTLHLPRTNPYPAFAQNKSLPCIYPKQILTLHLQIF